MALQETLAGMMVFISQQTGLPIPEVPPAVTEASHCDVQEAAGLPCENNYGAQGLYVEGTHIVVVSTINKTDNPEYYYGTMIHEVVHYMQDKAGTLRGASVCEIESQAYSVEVAFLESHNLEDTDWYEGMLVSKRSYGTCYSQGNPYF